MKKTLLAAMILCGLPGPSKASLIAEYNFDDVSGTTVFPDVGTVTGTLSGVARALSRSLILLVNTAAHSRTALRKINHLGPSTSARNPPKMDYSWRV